MKKIALCLIVLSSCFACRPQTPVSQVAPTHVNDVAWITLLRDIQTAHAYRNQKIRIRVDASDYALLGDELHIFAGQRTAPPAIICRGSVATANKDVTIIGVCRSVVRDGKWRSPRTDFYIVVEECVIMGR